MTTVFRTLRQASQMTVVLQDDLDVRAAVDRETCTVWVSSDQSDDEIVEVASEALRMLLSQRPRLTVLDGGAET
jgi:hypothetical protein